MLLPINRMEKTLVLLLVFWVNTVAAENNPTSLILFMFSGLLICICITQLLSYIGDVVPYAVVVFVTGLLISLLSLGEEIKDGIWLQASMEWANITPDLLLYIFLPPLIFSEAMSLNWFHVVGGFWQSFLLAGPGVVLGTFAYGAIVKGVIGWSWYLSFTMGSVLSATDTVAVVALLKRAGASPKLTILIVCESLMNDGTAMVLFNLFFNLLNGKTYNAGQIVEFFVTSCIGSPLFGANCGFLIVRWLRLASRSLKDIDVTVQIALTVVCSFLIFYAAQGPFQISGALSCYAAGAMLAWLAPAVILSHESMHNVWNMLEWIGNSLIFLLAGLIIGQSIKNDVNAYDWGYLFFFWFLLFALRAVIVAILFPLLSRIGHKCTVNEAVFMSWGGFRGALSVALAIQVQGSSATAIGCTPAQLRRFLFYVGGVAALSLLINATLAEALLTRLNLLGSLTVEQTMLLDKIRRRIEVKHRDSSSSHAASGGGRSRGLSLSAVMLAGDSAKHGNAPAGTEEMSPLSTSPPTSESEMKEWEPDVGVKKGRQTFEIDRKPSFGVARSSSRDSASMSWRERLSSTSLQERRFLGNELERLISLPRQDVNEQLLAYVRLAFLGIVRAQYWHQIEHGHLPRLSHSSRFLLYSIEIALDDGGKGTLSDWSIVQRELESVPWYIWLLEYINYFMTMCYLQACTLPLLKQLKKRQMKRQIYLLMGFCEAHEQAQAKMHSFLNDEVVLSFESPEEGIVKRESNTELREARSRLEALPDEVVKAVKEQKEATVDLTSKIDFVRGLIMDGMLSGNDGALLMEEFREDAAAAKRRRKEEQTIPKRTVFTSSKALPTGKGSQKVMFSIDKAHERVSDNASAVGDEREGSTRSRDEERNISVFERLSPLHS